MKSLLLDTNAYFRLLGGDETVLEALAEAENVLMSVIVLGELFDGFKAGSREKKNTATLKRFLEKPEVKIFPATYETSQVYGVLKQELKKAGTPIPINDVWIASQALESGSVLLTFDRHFDSVPGIRLWKF